MKKKKKKKLIDKNFHAEKLIACNQKTLSKKPQGLVYNFFPLYNLTDPPFFFESFKLRFLIFFFPFVFFFQGSVVCSSEENSFWDLRSSGEKKINVGKNMWSDSLEKKKKKKKKKWTLFFTGCIIGSTSLSLLQYLFTRKKEKEEKINFYLREKAKT